MEQEKEKEEIKQIQKKTNKIVLITFAIVMIIILSVAGVTSIVSNIEEKKKQEQLAIEESNKVTVPNLVGMTYKEVKEEIEKLELQVDAKLGNLEDDNIVTTQDPSAEKRVKKGETVTIYLKTPVTAKSDNFYGMRFRKTISEFCTEYNKKLESIYEMKEKDKTAINLNTLKNSDFSYVKNEEQTKLKIYQANQPFYNINLFVENDSDYIVYANVLWNPRAVANESKFYDFILTEIYPSIISALTNISYSEYGNIFREMTEKKGALWKNNIVYTLNNSSGYEVCYIYATSNEKYNELIEEQNNNNFETQETNEESTSGPSSSSNSNKNNSSNATQQNSQSNSKPSTSSSSTTTSNNTNKPSTSSDSSNKTNTSTSTSNNNSSSNNNNETYQTKPVTATFNIKIKELIDKNATAQQIVKSDNIYLRTEIKENGDRIDFLGTSYHSVNEIPNTITQKYDTVLTSDYKAAKFTVIIEIYDNIAGTKATLYNKDITIDKTGTYEIK